MDNTQAPETAWDGSKFLYEEAAAKGEEMPKGLTIPDQIMFLGLRMIYGSYRLGIISLEVARKEKNGLIRKCDYFRFRDQLSEGWAEGIKKTEAARAAYRKQRTLENADRLLAAVEGR